MAVIEVGILEQKEEENKGIVRLVEMSGMVGGGGRGCCRLGSGRWTDYLFPFSLSTVQRSGVLPSWMSVQANRSENWSGWKEEQEALKRLPDHLKRTTNKAEEKKVKWKRWKNEDRMTVA
jgi:hypothetical protein